METASLRIKFTPLIQEDRKNNSKCCIEIVPEVTCIQNLERIDWHQKSDSIEYTIPMTYKVILRRRQGVKESAHDLEKVYHSCVDLLPNSSSTCFSLGGGDNMMRMISDSLIYDSFRATIVNEMPFVKHGNAELKFVTNSKDDMEDKQIDANNVMLSKFLNEISTENISMSCSIAKVDASTSQLFNKNIDSADNNSAGKITCYSGSNIQLYKGSKTECEETVTSTGSCNKLGSLRKLSVTPIYSIDTIETNVDHNITFLTPHPTMDSLFKTPKMTIKNFMEIQLLDDNDETITDKNVLDKAYYKYKQKKSFRVYKRELPEVRVANFIKKMETEIMPLKRMLHDILQKCTIMGLIIDESFRIQEHPITNNQLVKYCTSKKQTKCNRVVYSIVFDG